MAGWLFVASIGTDLAREGLIEAPTGQGSFASDGIWSKNGLVRKKKEKGKKRKRKKRKEERERKVGEREKIKISRGRGFRFSGRNFVFECFKLKF